MNDCRETLRVGRRHALKTIAALTVAPQLAACAVGPTRTPDAIDTATAAGRARAFVLMRGALDDRVVIGNLVGSYNGVVDDIVEPLVGLVAATFSRYRALPDGGFAIVSFEQAYYTTIDGSRVLDDMVNPYTGKTVQVPVWTGEPTIQFMSTDLRITAAKPRPLARFAQSTLRMDANADALMFVERVSVGTARDGRARSYNEIVTLTAPSKAVFSPTAVQVGCATSVTSVLSWRDWLEMDQRSGLLMGHGIGGYGIAATALPALFVAETRRRRPEAMADPAAYLEPTMRELDALLAKR